MIIDESSVQVVYSFLFVVKNDESQTKLMSSGLAGNELQVSMNKKYIYMHVFITKDICHNGIVKYICVSN